MTDIDLSGALPFIENFENFTESALDALRILKDGTGEGGELTGWVWLPEQYEPGEIERIKTAAGKIRENSEALVVVGIGGSYLASRAAIEFSDADFDVYYAGTGITRDSIETVIDKLKGRKFTVNAVSKSGNTAETMFALDKLRKISPEKIICTTANHGGELYLLAQREDWEIFELPENIGGRYSALTAAGLLPMAAAGLDIAKIIDGARRQMEISLAEFWENPSLRYAAARQALYSAGKKIEVLSYPGEKLRLFTEWWKQLFAESEGKNGRGIFPAGCQISADLHSLGQYMQDGERMVFETMLNFGDELENNEMLRCTAKGVRDAHISGGVPFIGLTAEHFQEEDLGALFTFFMISCGVSGYMMHVNPFDQPGVEEYKRNMTALLSRARYERV